MRDLTTGQKQQGGSTLTMQLARGFFLTPEKRIKRKIIEIVITFQLEHRFSKKQIFEIYANQINLGQRGSFAINGFGEASQSYFGKDVRQLDLAESALLAGMIQRPNYFSPYRHPDRAIERRNLVLDAMVETGSITKQQAEHAQAESLHLSTASVDASEAPYFVDLVHEQLLQKYRRARRQPRGPAHLHHPRSRPATPCHRGRRFHHPRRGRAGGKAPRPRNRVKKGEPPPPPTPITYPQVALVALNPHTGQVLALVGGRSYGISQVNHAVAHRPTGSIFKPLVYAAAFQTALAGTPLSAPAKVVDASADANPNGNTVVATNPQQNGATPPPPDPVCT